MTRHGDPDDRWDRDDTAATLDGFHVERTDEPEETYRGMFASVFEVPDDARSIFVVYADYDTGDTFGRDDNQIMIMEVCDDLFEAQSLARTLEQAAGWSVTVNGIEYYIPWNGYFEHLNSVSVYTVALKS